jgi:hypothetical protein
VPVAYIPYIVGKKGVTIKRLQKDFNCHVTVPRSGKGGLVKIKAYDAKSLTGSKKRLGELISSARQQGSKHKIILELKLATNTIQECKAFGNQYIRVNEGTIQFVNPAVYKVVIANTSLSEEEAVTAKEILAQFQPELPQDIRIAEMDCQEKDKVQEDF